MPGIDESEKEFKYRLKDPALFKEGSYVTTDLGDGVSLVVGTLKDGGKKIGQSLRFSKPKFSDSASVQKWLDGHWKDEPIAGQSAIAWQAGAAAVPIIEYDGLTLDIPEGEIAVRSTVLGVGEFLGWDVTQEMIKPEEWVGRPWLAKHSAISHKGSTLIIDDPRDKDGKILAARKLDTGEMEIVHTVRDPKLQAMANKGELHDSIQGWPMFDTTGKFTGIEPRAVAGTLEPEFDKDKSRQIPLNPAEALNLTFTAGASSAPPSNSTNDGGDRMADEIKELKERVATLEKENADLAKKVSDAEASDVEALTEKVQKIEAELSKGKEELESLTKELETYHLKDKETLAKEALEVEMDLAEEEMNDEAQEKRLKELVEMEMPALKETAVSITAQAYRAMKEAASKNGKPGESRSVISGSRGAGGKADHEKLYEEGKETFDKFGLKAEHLSPDWTLDKGGE